MKKLNFLLSLLFVGCTSELEVKLPQSTQMIDLTNEELRLLPILTEDSHSISMEEARQKSQDIITFLLEDDIVSRSNNDCRMIKDINAVTKVKTRSKDSNLPDTIAYVCNFDNNLGYAIISADNRTEESILSYAGEGNIGVDTDNPGFALFLDNAEDYISESIYNFELKKDSILNEIVIKLKNQIPEEELPSSRTFLPNALSRILVFETTKSFGNWELLAKKGPLLPVEWGQYSPYNENVKYINSADGKTPTGCVATAAAQIMSYWKYPLSIEGYIFDWNEMNDYSGRIYGSYKKWNNYMSSAPKNIKVQVANLMEIIGKKVGMNYDPDGSGAQTSKIPYMLRSLGYNINININALHGYGYSYSLTKQALDKNRPVLAKGSKGMKKRKFLGITIRTTYSGGHAWVIDGYMDRRRKVTQTTTIKYRTSNKIVSSKVSEYYEYSSMIHNNWGWDGQNNGFYNSGCFNSTSGKQEESNVTRSNGENNFQYNNAIYPFIKR